ncbi:hypothetical protein AtNW77_Chr1g0046591 [Arabidopsis thaliana]
MELQAFVFFIYIYNTNLPSLLDNFLFFFKNIEAFLSNQKMRFILRSICFLLLVSSFLNTFVSSTQHLCDSDQRDALLEFKKECLIQKTTWVDLK